MFGEKCPRCGKKIKKNFEFCPYCSTNLSDNSEDTDYGFLGKNDIKELDDFKLPFGFNALMKPLMKELVKQMSALDKELANEKNTNKVPMKTNTSSFSIHIGMPGQKPIKFVGSSAGNRLNFSQVNSGKNIKPVAIKLPKISDSDLVKLKKLVKKEPKTGVRRLADRIIYEINLPGVKNLNHVNINKLEDAIELKAFSDKELFVKDIKVSMPLIGYSFADEMLVLELLAR